MAGSFTVEASLLMTVFLPVITALIYLGFYDHDRGVMLNSLARVAASADLKRYRKRAVSKVEEKGARYVKSSLIAARNRKCSVSVSDKKVSAQASGTIQLPGLLPRLFGKQTLKIQETIERELPDPTGSIRIIRGLEYMSETLKG